VPVPVPYSLKRAIRSASRRMIEKFVPIPKTHWETIAEYVCAEAVEGDYLEFGVFRGGSFISAYHALEDAIADWSSERRNACAYSGDARLGAPAPLVKTGARYFAFDSFEGLPDVSGVDAGNSRFTKGRYNCSEEEFRAILSRYGVDLDKVTTVPGWYDDSLTDEIKQRHGLTAAAVVMVDCDLYESTRPVLAFITDLVVDGTVIVFDDWFNYRGNPLKGERRAVAEWLAANPRFQLTDYHMGGSTQKSFILNIVEPADNE